MRRLHVEELRGGVVSRFEKAFAFSLVSSKSILVVRAKSPSGRSEKIMGQVLIAFRTH